MSAVGLRIDAPCEGVVKIELDRPRTRNALDDALVAGLRAAIAAHAEDVIVLASTDPRAFSAGLDRTLPRTQRVQLSDDLYALYSEMVAAGPIVAAVNGPAVGGGAQLALAADLRFGGPACHFRFAAVGHGLAVGPWALSELVGRGRAFELCATTRAVDADEALAIGLLNAIATDPTAAAVECARRLAVVDAAALRRVKQILDLPGPRADRLARERVLNGQAWDGRLPEDFRSSGRR